MAVEGQDLPAVAPGLDLAGDLVQGPGCTNNKTIVGY